MSARRRGWWSRAAHLAVPVATWAAIFGPALLGGGVFLERDLYSFHRPLKALLVPLVLASDGLPTWNPWLGGGQPFAANPQQQLWHPFTALFYLLPFERAMTAHVVLPALLGLLLIWALQRARGRSRVAAALSALAWGCGGLVLSSWHLLPLSLGALALPAVGFAARAAARGQRGGQAGLASAIFLLAAAGEPSTLLLGPVVVWAASVETRARRWGRVLAGGCAGLALAAVVLLPAADLWEQSARAAGLARDEAVLWALHPWRLVELVLPWSLFGAGDGVDALGVHAGRATPFLASLYAGLLISTLALLACLPASVRARPRAWRRLAWAALAAVALLLALGPHVPGGTWWHALPPLAGLRFPERFMMTFALALALLAGDGWDRLRALLRRPARRPGLLVAGLVLVPAAGGAHLLTEAARLAGDPVGGRLLRDGPRLLLMTALVAGLVYVVARRPRLAGALALLALAADLAFAGRSLVSTRPAADAREPLVLARLREAGAHGSMFNEAGWSRASGESYRLGLLRAPLPAQWGWAMQLEPDFDRSESAVARMAKKRVLALTAAQPRLGEHVLRRRGVHIRLRLRSDVGVRAGRLVLRPDLDTLIEPRLLDAPAPEAFLAERVVLLASEAEWERAIADLGALAGRAVLVERTVARSAGWPVNDAPMAGPSVSAREQTPGRLTARRERANARTWDVEAIGPEGAVLALNQTWNRGWHARIDGRPARVARVDLGLMAVHVPAGRHRVSLSYEERAASVGLALSVVTALALVAASCWPRARARRA
jgi:hypothetical protein